MRIKLKEAITTGKGVTFPAGYTFEADTLLNLSNGFTQFGNVAEIRPGSAVLTTVEEFSVGTRDVAKLEVTLDLPA